MIINLLISVVNAVGRAVNIIINRVKYQLVEISINYASECILAHRQSRSQLSAASDDCAFRRIINHLTIATIKQPKVTFFARVLTIISKLTSKVTYEFH